jgi:ATP-dependent DNA helicase RecG
MHAPTPTNPKKNFSLLQLPGVGSRRAAVLSSLGIQSVRDLLYYFPRGYLDRSRITKINQLRRYVYSDQHVTVVGKVVAMDVVGGRGGAKRFILVLDDGSGSVECVFFGGVQWFQKMFRIGEVLAVSSRPELYKGTVQFVHPEFDRLSLDAEEEGEIDWDRALHTGAIIPQYRVTEEARRVKLDSRAFRRIIKAALTSKMDLVEDTLSSSIVEKHHLLEIYSALRSIHFPGSWEELEQARHRLKFDELFYLQLLLAYRKREVKLEQQGVAFDVKSTLARRLVDSLPFELTRAQRRVIREIADDMSSSRPMSRLLQGDVGSGKTVVALIAMLIAIENGYQAVFMAPTEVLAEQHFHTLKNFLRDIPINMIFLIGGQRRRHRREILEQVKSGSARLIVGTHALIQEPVEFHQLGLAVIDEQHRFGVLQRAVLREKAWKSSQRPIHPDVLVMTATPIPRSLALTAYGDLDVSVIDEMPKHRRPIQTMLKSDSEREQVYEFVRREIAKGRQAYIVYPLIEESEKIDLQAATKNFERLRDETFRNLTVELIHGRMPPETKDEIMDKFKLGKINILVATTVIEVGIDVPNATMMVIENAERFGLAQLHQLRGRVGRGSEQSYCILVAKGRTFAPHSSRPILSLEEQSEEMERRKAETRLRTIMETTDGFKIAEVDLALRGPGEFFGTKQSGLPQMQIANIVTDADILKIARREAFQLVHDDPQLRRKENLPVRRHFLHHYREELKFLRTG